MWIWLANAALAGLTVDVDPRVELLQALLHAAGADELSHGDPEYQQALDARFAAHLDDPAVDRIRWMRSHWGIGYNSPAALAVLLGADDRLTVPLRPFPANMDDRWDHPGAVRRWLVQVHRFREEVGWDRFLADQLPRFQATIDAARTALDGEHLPDWFAAAFGAEPDVHVHLSPLSGNNNFGAGVPRADGTVEQHAVVGAISGWGDNALRVLVHEIAHGYANPVADREPAMQSGAAAVMPIAGKQMADHAYPGPRVVADETLTRALTVLYLRDRHPELVDEDLGDDEGKGFGWIEAAVDALVPFHSGPGVDLVGGAPAVGHAMEAWAALPAVRRVPPFRGTVNAAMTRVRAVVTPESGPVADYATQVFHTFYEKRGATLATASSQAVAPKGGLVAYGSPASNAWVARIAAMARWSLQTDGVGVDGRWFPGDHLALIACWPTPDDPTGAFAVYGAASDADLVDINTVFHGPWDWQVVRRGPAGLETVAHGSFVHGADGWSLPGPPLAPLVDPASVGLDPTALAALLRRATESRSDAIEVWVDGTTVVRWPEVQAPIETMSATKSVVDLGIGALVGEGRIDSIDAPASRWIPALDRGAYRKITLRMLLEHTSGLAPVQSRDIYAAPDIVALAASQPLATRPGDVWAYNNSAANLVTAIGTRAAGVPFDQYVQDHVLAPIGIGPRTWAHDPAGNVQGGAGLELTADDLLRIGRLMLDQGGWDGRAVVPADWVAASVAPSAHADWFGRQWWVSWRNKAVVGFRADGWLGQLIVVVPERHLVAVRQMRATPEIWADGDQGVDTFKDFQDRVLDLVHPPVAGP